MNKTTWTALVAVAFVAGSLVTGSVAFADDDKKGNPIVNALNNIANAINGIEPSVEVNPTVNVPPAEVQVVGVEGPSGPPGPQGPQGEVGAKGEPGEIKTPIRVDGQATLMDPGVIGEARVTCPVNYVLISGGFATSTHSTTQVAILNNMPGSNGDGSPVSGWYVSGRASSTNTGQAAISAHAICMPQ